jgi:uncharacterized membrane protein
VWAVAPDRSTLAASSVLAAAAVAAAVADRAPTGDGRRRVPFLSVASGWALVAVIEVVSVVNDFDRMNTVFKGWFQAWLLLALGLGGALAATIWPASEGAAPAGVRRAGRMAGTAGLVAAALLVVAFVQLAVPARLDDRTSRTGLSLDGLAYLDELQLVGDGQALQPGDDRPLIEWLQQHVEGIVTIAEAPGNGYTWSGRMAAHTGLPTIVGWPYHQTQQRRAYEGFVNRRVADADALYTSGDPVAITSVLQAYGVEYVVFGTLERALASDDSEAALRGFPCLEVVFESGPHFVADVDQACLPDRPGGVPVRAADARGSG